MKHETVAGMTWDVCEPTHGSSGRLSATINVDEGRVTISGAAYSAAGRPAAVLVLYSRENKSFGLKPANPRDHSTLVVSGNTRAGKQVSARILTRRMAADGYTGRLAVPLQWHPEGLLWGDLTMARKAQRRASRGGGQ